jgi:cytochrome b561
VRSLQTRWLTALAAVPPVLVTLITVGPLSVQAAAAGTASTSTGSLDPSERFQLGVALVALGILILAVTIVRLRIQSRQRRRPALVGSSRRKFTDTWDGYYTAPSSRKSSARATARSTW